jgi:uncharacterized protein
MDLRERLNKLYGKPAPSDNLRARLQKLTVSQPDDSLAFSLGGNWVERPGGRLLIVERSFDGIHPHGSCSLGEIYRADPQSISLLAGSDSFHEFHPDEAVFLDTETTGLAGGAGTCVFLIGAAYFNRSRFTIRQFFLPGFDSERVFLKDFDEWINSAPGGRRFRYLVTFNGKSYDMNLLESRFILQRLTPPCRSLQHLDLLYPSRTLWKGRFEGCALQVLERRLLGILREKDIPSALIPQIYFNYLHWGESRSFPEVFEHNRIDLLSLVSLLTVACLAVEQPGGRYFLDAEAAAHLYMLRGHYQRAAQLLEDALAKPSRSQERLGLLLQLARLKKRLGESESALSLWREMIDAYPRAPLETFEEAAKLLEHRFRAFQEALQVVSNGLAVYPDCPELQRRVHRLECRIAGRKWY